MTLAAHSLVGATMVKILPGSPFLAVGLAFLSHFVLDAIPHWDYPLRSASRTSGPVTGVDLKFNKSFLRDLFFIFLDLSLGLFLVWLIYNPGLTEWPWFLLGIGAGVLPDFLQFAYGKLNWRVLALVQRWHNFCHSHISLNGKNFWGISSQIVIVLSIVFLMNYLFVL